LSIRLRRTFTGAWIETSTVTILLIRLHLVAPSRVRGLKHHLGVIIPLDSPSHLHGCVD
jgi:hypothetical protein